MPIVKRIQKALVCPAGNMSPLWLILASCLVSATSHLDESSISFLQKGELVLRPTFGYVFLNISLLEVFKTFDDLQDRVDTVTAFKTTQLEIKLHRMLMHSQHIRMKALWSILQKRVTDLPSGLINQYNQTIVKYLNQSPSNGTQTNSTNQDRKRRHIISRTPYRMDKNTAVTHGLKDQGIEEDEDHYYDGELPPEIVTTSQLRITYTMDDLKQMLSQLDEATKTFGNSTAAEMLKLLQVAYQMMTTAVAGELDDFSTAIDYLVDGRISPHLVDIQELDEAYKKLINKAAVLGAKPLNPDFNVLFRQKAAAIYFEGTDIKVFISVPLYHGDKVPLWQYNFFPLPITERLTLNIQPNLAFVAWTKDGKNLVELNEVELSKCETIDNNWVCPTLPILRKDLESSCLHNLFYQNPNAIMRTCPLRVGILKDFASMIAPNQYRIFGPDDSLLIQECINEDESVISQFRNEAYLNLTWNCPKAETENYTFFYNPIEGKSGRYLHHELTPEMKDWLENLLPNDAIRTAEQLIEKEEIQEIVLIELKERLTNRVWKQIKETSHYAFFVTLIFAVFLPISWCCTCKRNKQNMYRNNSKRNSTIIRVPHHKLRPLAEKMMEMETVTVLE